MEDDGSLLILHRETDSDIINANDGDLSFTELGVSDPNSEEQIYNDGINAIDEIDLAEILQKELQSLELLKKSNASIRELISCVSHLPQTGTASAMLDVATMSSIKLENAQKTEADVSVLMNSCKNQNPPVDVDNHNDNEKDDEPSDLIKPEQNETAYNKWSSKAKKLISARFRARRQRLKGNDEVTRKTIMQTCMGTASRYIILASVISFCTAFVLLSWYSSQTHRNNMELFKFKENQAIDQQSTFEKAQMQNVNFRETVIHQRYEEARECQSTLQTCHTTKDKLQTKITKIEKDASVIQLTLQTELDQKQEEILKLQGQVRMLRDANQELKTEVSHTFSASFSQIFLGLLNILKNKTVQIGIATFIGCTTLLLLALTMFSK